MNKRIVIKLSIAAAVFASAFAMAASLGGITGNKLGADSTTVASCDTDGVATAYTTAYDATDAREEITTVTVSGVADTCDGQNLKVVLTSSTNASLSSATLAIPTSAATSHAVTMSPAPSAKDSANVHVTIAQ